MLVAFACRATNWEDAELRAPDLARALARIELAFGNWGPISASGEALEAAIRSGWLDVVASARQGKVSIDPAFIASLHAQIARAIGAPGPGNFREGEHPLDWRTVLAQLHWGKHLDSLMFSVAWLTSGGIRLQEGMQMLVPYARRDEELKERLAWAGPRSYDAEGLRGLLARYASEQIPDLSPP